MMLRTLSLLLCSLVLLAVDATAADSSLEALREAGHWKRLRQMAEPQAANPKDASAAYFLSCAKSAFGDLDGALEMAQRAVSLDSGNSQYHLQLGVAYGRKANKASFFKAMSLGGQYKNEMKKAAELDPKNIDALWELMEFYWHAPAIAGGDQKKARSTIDDIMHINPAKGYLALAELAQGKEEDVEDYYRKAAAADPKSYDAQVRLARFYSSDQQKNYDLAEKHAQQAIAIDPGRGGSYKLMAALYARQARWHDLDSVLSEAESRVRDDLSAYFQAGLEILSAGNDPQRAERYFRKYLSQEPEAYAPHLSRGHWRLGQALEKQGRKTDAIAEFETALRLEPDLEDAKKDLKRLKQ